MIHATANGVYGKELKYVGIHFKSPLESINLNVFSSKNDNCFLPGKLFSTCEVLCKLVAVPVHGKTVFVPLHHTLPTGKI